MKNTLDRDAIRAIIWQALVDRANGRTPNTIQPIVPPPAPVEHRKRDLLRELAESQRPAENPVQTILSQLAHKTAEDKSAPSEPELRRMYDVVQADARLSKQLEGLGFGRTGDAYRNAALKLRLMSLMSVLRDGKNIRNDIVHKPGYIPSEQSSARALLEYSQAADELQHYLNAKRNPAV